VARQVLTLPDVPPTLLTQSAGDARYLPLSHEPGTDPHTQYLNTSRGDARYYTQAQADAKYALVAHNHDAAYSPTTHHHDAAYVNVGGDSMSGDLTITANIQQNRSSGAAEHNLRKPDDQWANIQFKRTDDTPRLLLGATPTSNNLELHTYDDAGAYVGRAFGVERVNRNFHIDQSLYVPNTANINRLALYGGWTMQLEGPNFVFRDETSKALLVVWDSGLAHWQGGDWAVTSGSLSASGNITTSATMTCNTLYASGWVMAGQGAAAYTWLTTDGLQHHGNTALNIYAADGMNIQFNPSGGIIHPPNETVHLGWPGLRWNTVRGITFWGDTFQGPGQTQINSGGGAPMIVTVAGGAGSIYLRSGNFIYCQGAATAGIVPETNNQLYCGYPDNRWITVFSTNGVATSSSRTLKDDLVPLDPGACYQAAKEVVWYDFRFKEPVFVDPDPEEDEEPGAYSQRHSEAREAFATQLAQTAPSRHQRGYVIEEAPALFGLEDRQSTVAQADLATLGCAVQEIIRRLEAIEEKNR
jgi:hypothetical protein